MSKISDITNEELMDIAAKYMESRNAKAVVEFVNELWKRKGSPRSITREQVYPNLARACDRGLIALTPELHQLRSQQIAGKFGFSGNDIKVISCRNDLGAVASATAEVALEQIQILGEMKGRNEWVHVGLGAGKTSSLVCQFLANRLRLAKDVPNLVLHAISSGFDVDEPEKSPVSYFGYFRPSITPIKFVGLFAPAAVEATEYESVKNYPGVKKAFARRKEIDLVITSFASAADPHGDLNKFHKLVPGSATSTKERVGDVQYRSYDEHGPLVPPSGMRAVTLFELKDLVRMAKDPKKKVILVAGPCAACNKTREDALLPLMQNKKLKVWNQLVLDLNTAAGLLGRDEAERFARAEAEGRR